MKIYATQNPNQVRKLKQRSPLIKDEFMKTDHCALMDLAGLGGPAPSQS